MAFNATTFKMGNPFGGARPSLFQVNINLPLPLKAAIGIAGTAASTLISFRARTSQLPGRTISTSEVPYMGRTVKVNGAPTFEDWETTIYEDEDFSIHELIVKWMHVINNNRTNTMHPAAMIPGSGQLDYMATAKVTVMSKSGLPIRQVTLENCWPTVLGAAELDWANNDEILNFPVTWAMSHWTWDGHMASVAKGLVSPEVIAPIAVATGSAVLTAQQTGAEAWN